MHHESTWLCVVFQSLYFQHQDNPSARQRKSSDGSSQHVSVYAVLGAGMCLCHPLTEALVLFELTFNIMIKSNLTCNRKSQFNEDYYEPIGLKAEVM